MSSFGLRLTGSGAYCERRRDDRDDDWRYRERRRYRYRPTYGDPCRQLSPAGNWVWVCR